MMVGADYLYWQSIERNGALNGIGKPEALKYRKGFSRRIDKLTGLFMPLMKMGFYG